MALEYVQAQIGYQFIRPESLLLALKAAHRSDLDGIADDGNRGLAMLGVDAVNLTETYYTIIVEKGTRRDVNTQDHWFRDKRKRANVCKALGIDQFVTRSPRQHDKPHSVEVLANALSAIVGVIWLDLQIQNGNVTIIVEQIFLILRKMETALAHVGNSGSLLTTPSIADGIQTPPSQTTHESQEGTYIDGYITTGSGGMISQDSDRLAYDQVPPHDTASNSDPLEFVQDFDFFDFFDFGSDATGSVWTCLGLPDMNEITAAPDSSPTFGNEEAAVVDNDSVITNDNPQPAVKSRKRKSRSEQTDKYDETALHKRLLQEELEKSKDLPSHVQRNVKVLLDHDDISALDSDAPQLTRLRLLYVSIGSLRSLIGFKDMLHMARKVTHTYFHAAGSDLCPPERYEEICRLANQEALSVLLRRYHVVKLFKTTQENLQHDGGLIIETPSSLMVGQRAMSGNPANRARANLTDEVLRMILPGPANGSPKYQKTRQHISQLRRLANVLSIWTDVYGFGILALLPSSQDHSGFNLTDSMLLNLTEKRLRAFSDPLYRHQGHFLTRLSEIVEPALMALVDGNLSSFPKFPIETVGVDVFEGLPKGCGLENLM